MFYILAICLYFALISLPLGNEVLTRAIDQFAIFLMLLQFAIWTNTFTQRMLERIKLRRVQSDPGSVAVIGMMELFARLVVWGLIFILGLHFLDIPITGLIAGLGVGGIAVAFALQNILADLFCSVAILIDKPFTVGDFIIVGTEMGSVEHIGLKTTRLRSLGGEQLIFSNQDILGSRIRNYSAQRMYERRVLFAFGLVYQTPPELIEKVKLVVSAIIQSNEGTRLERVHFKAFGAFSLDFEAVYFMLTADYKQYMDTQERINLAMMKRFSEMGVEFAYPTQELLVKMVRAEPRGDAPPACE
jgi:small-conductance mechanosensitive channel